MQGDATTIEAVGRLGDDYAISLDERDLGRFLRLWVADSTLEVFDTAAAPPAVGVLRAPDRLSVVFDRLAAYDRTLHHLTTRSVLLNGARATAVSYCEAHHLLGAEDLVMHIRYDDDLVRQTDGGWRFARRQVHVLFTEHCAVTPR